MDKERKHQIHFFVKTALKAASVGALFCIAHQLERIHHRMKKMEKCEKHHKLL